MWNRQILYFLRSMSWPWSPVRSILKRCHCVSFSRLVSLRFTRMLLRPGLLLCSSFLLFCLLTLETDTAYAQTETPCTDCTTTPTPEFEHLFVTSTPNPTKNFNCPPVGQHVTGWGTVTPGVLWSAECGNCLMTLTPHSTEVVPTSTGTITVTPSPTSAQTTPTATFPPTPTSWGGPIALKSITKWKNGSNTVIDSQDVTCNVAIGGSSDTVTCSMAQTCHGTSGTLQCGMDIAVSTVAGTSRMYYRLVRNGISDIDPGSGTYTANSPIEGYYDIGTTNKIFKLRMTFTGYTSMTQTGYFEFSNRPMTTPTPTPTITPTPNNTPTPTPLVSYCSSVNGVTPNQEDWDFGMLPDILVGTASCVGWNETSVDLSAINWIPGMDNWEAFDLPAVQFCFKPVYFGSVNLFGAVINYDYLTMLMVGVLVFRMFFRS